jgi:hypothetical protein
MKYDEGWMASAVVCRQIWSKGASFSNSKEFGNNAVRDSHDVERNVRRCPHSSIWCIPSIFSLRIKMLSAVQGDAPVLMGTGNPVGPLFKMEHLRVSDHQLLTPISRCRRHFWTPLPLSFRKSPMWNLSTTVVFFNAIWRNRFTIC